MIWNKRTKGESGNGSDNLQGWENPDRKTKGIGMERKYSVRRASGIYGSLKIVLEGKRGETGVK